MLLYYRSLTVRADITQLVKGLPKSEANHFPELARQADGKIRSFILG